MEILEILALLVAAILAGGMNSVAGGGSFITFPILIYFGMPAILANTTNCVALLPGSIASAFAYRREIRSENRRILRNLCITSFVGGCIGAVIILLIKNSTFESMVPYLLLFATILFALGSRVSAIAKSLSQTSAFSIVPHYITRGIKYILHLIIAIYGGFFGAGIGIMTLALLSSLGMTNINQMNSLKTILNSVVNSVAVLIFIATGFVSWPHAAIMVVGAMLGGYLGARQALKTNPKIIRSMVIVLGCVLSTYFFMKN